MYPLIKKKNNVKDTNGHPRNFLFLYMGSPTSEMGRQKLDKLSNCSCTVDLFPILAFLLSILFVIIANIEFAFYVLTTLS